MYDKFIIKFYKPSELEWAKNLHDYIIPIYDIEIGKPFCYCYGSEKWKDKDGYSESDENILQDMKYFILESDLLEKEDNNA